MRLTTPPGATNATFIEISPHPLLTKAISDTLDDPKTGNKHHHSLGTLQRDIHDTVAFRKHFQFNGMDANSNQFIGSPLSHSKSFGTQKVTMIQKPTE
jgi:hypothetical protein